MDISFVNFIQRNWSSSRKPNWVWLFVVVTLWMASCRTPPIQSSDKKLKPENDQTNADERIAFYFFSITRNEKGEIQVSLKDKKIVPGNLKPAVVNLEASRGAWRFTFTDASTTPTYTEVIDDPLNPVVEYISDTGAMAKKTIAKSSAEITIRVAYNPAATQVIIEKFVNESETKRISLITIK